MENYISGNYIIIFNFWQIVRLLANHPHFGITLMTADRKAGQSFGSVFPHLIAQVRGVYYIDFRFGMEIQVDKSQDLNRPCALDLLK